MSEQSAADVIAEVLGDVTDWPAHEWTHEAAAILAALEAAGYVVMPQSELDRERAQWQGVIDDWEAAYAKLAAAREADNA